MIVDNKIHLAEADIGKWVLLRDGSVATVASGCCNTRSLYPFTLSLLDGSAVRVTAAGAYWNNGSPDPCDVVEVLGRPFRITPKDVGRTVRLRGGGTAKIDMVRKDPLSIYPDRIDCTRGGTGGVFSVSGYACALAAVAFTDDPPADPRAENAAKAVGRFLAVESDRTSGELDVAGFHVRGAFDTVGEAEEFIKDDTVESYGDGSDAGDPEAFSGDWFIVEIKRVVRPVPVPVTETACRLDTLAGRE